MEIKLQDIDGKIDEKELKKFIRESMRGDLDPMHDVRAVNEKIAELRKRVKKVEAK